MSHPFERSCRALLLLLALVPTLLLAAEPASGDPPARVGRLAYIENSVEFRVDRDDPGGPASINWPISSGALLDTGAAGRAEAWIGSTAYRLADNGSLQFSTVDDQRVDLQLSAGSLAVSILDPDQAADLTIFTPDGSVRFAGPGRYRIDVRDDRTELTVHAGQASLGDPARSTPVGAGQTASLYTNGRIGMASTYRQDVFDRWVAERESATLANTSRRLVSAQMTGYQDLDSYGDWRPEQDYGTVWYPRTVAADWAPYRHGRWAWVAPWGWTWIDEAPWGFAPFHYGRWVHVRGRWGWSPGRPAPRPVYAPALVGWIGNPGWNVQFRAGAAPAVGWFPLAPREVYVPAYRYSPTYIRQINVTHVHNEAIIEQARRGDRPSHFAYRDAPLAVTVVPATLLREGRRIGRDDIEPADRRHRERPPVAQHAPTADWLAPIARPVRTADPRTPPLRGEGASRSRPASGDLQSPAYPGRREGREPGRPQPETGGTPMPPAAERERGRPPGDRRSVEGAGSLPSGERAGDWPGRRRDGPTPTPAAPRINQDELLTPGRAPRPERERGTEQRERVERPTALPPTGERNTEAPGRRHDNPAPTPTGLPQTPAAPRIDQDELLTPGRATRPERERGTEQRERVERPTALPPTGERNAEAPGRRHDNPAPTPIGQPQIPAAPRIVPDDSANPGRPPRHLAPDESPAPSRPSRPERDRDPERRDGQRLERPTALPSPPARESEAPVHRRDSEAAAAFRPEAPNPRRMPTEERPAPARSQEHEPARERHEAARSERPPAEIRAAPRAEPSRPEPRRDESDHARRRSRGDEREERGGR